MINSFGGAKGLELALLNSLGQRDRLGGRFSSQFGLQYLAALGVLGQSRLALAQTGISPHQGPIPILAQIVQAQQLMRGLNRRRVIVPAFILRQAFLQRGLVAAPQPLAFKEEPILKAVGVSDVQPFQEIAPVQVELARFKGGHVQPVVALKVEGHLTPVGQDVITPDGFSKLRQGPAQ